MSRRILPFSAAVVVLAACAGEEAMLDPFGPPAQTSATIWWILFWMGLAVYVVVMALVFLAFRRARRRSAEEVAVVDRDEDTHPAARRLVLYGGLIGPAIVLLVLNLITVPMTAMIEDRGPTAAVGDDGVVIDVVAEKFWWRVDYPQFDVTTANEIHIPAGERVQLRITSADVIHSFWIPKLGGKIDATPGHTTSLTLEADEPGRYRGRCTEYCGLAHAQMIVFVIAQERDDFEDWVEHQSQPQPELTDERLEQGREQFFGSACVYCHNIDGHGPPNDIGPDLTHLASRETIAGGILPNTRGHLADWTIDPQAQKPGNLMPGTQIAGDELDALLDYLMSLE